MKTRIYSAVLLLALTTPLTALAAASSQPNIIVILVDDMGFSDVGCYGSEIPTPNLDALAKGGLQFTDFHNDSRCCPSRATLLTGLYPHAAGVGHMTEARKDADGSVLPGYEGHLNDNCVTLAEVLHNAGYFTAMTGKWHVGQNGVNGVVPWKRGFDRSLDAPHGGYYYPGDKGVRLFLNGTPEGTGGRDGIPKDWYSTDLWTDYGLRFIDEAQTAKKPFFLYLAYNAPHFPLQAPPEDIAKFRGKYMAGWDKLREARYQRQVQMGIIDPSWPKSPRPPEVAAWDSLTPDQKDRFDHIMAIYAACVYHVDKEVGVLVAGLAKRGVLDNTLIMFMSDNGGNLESGPNGRLEGKMPGGPDSTVFCGQSWATLENTPFRRYKHFEHEGGISTPLIVHWPTGIPAKGELRTQPGHLIDIMATCVDVSGAKYPAEYNGHTVHPMEGQSLVPAFTNQPIPRDAIYWEHEGNAAILEGDWKLVRFQWNGVWELYNMKADRTEQHDLSGAQPDRVKTMAAKWNVWAKADHVLPEMHNNFEKTFHANANDGYGGTPALREPQGDGKADAGDASVDD
ncbi:MAG TPA: arylsulfatase [Verrucomicrobiae bacterium]|jgi:arylsulfatase